MLQIQNFGLIVFVVSVRLVVSDWNEDFKAESSDDLAPPFKSVRVALLPEIFAYNAGTRYTPAGLEHLCEPERPRDTWILVHCPIYGVETPPTCIGIPTWADWTRDLRFEWSMYIIPLR